MRVASYTRYGAPEVVQCTEAPAPIAGEHDVIVRNGASIVSAAESAARAGTDPAARLYFGLFRPRFPVLGNSFAGVVDSIGSAVTRFAVGDLVTGVTGTAMAAHAELVRCHEDGAIQLRPGQLRPGSHRPSQHGPSSHTPNQHSVEGSVAIFDGSLAALPFLDRAGLVAGQRILINGASGAVGTAAVQLAKARGAHVTAVCSAANGALVKALGADVVIDYATEDFTAAMNSFDVIFDTVATSSFRASRAALTDDGIYLTTVPTVGILISAALTQRSKKRAAIVFAGLRKPEQMRDDMTKISALVESGDFVPVIDSVFALDRAVDAHARVDTTRKRGSVVLTMNAPATS
jgi:NADPH:quinone reductase-like Zn-dependent oxidoreductase